MKRFIYGFGIIILLCISGCGKNPADDKSFALPDMDTEPGFWQTAAQTQPESETESISWIQSAVQPNERTIHNENNMEKDRFLAFFHNEIPVMGYPLGEPDAPLYYGDIQDLSSKEKQNEPCYAIMDITGNGETEYAFYNADTTVCMSYDEQYGRFDCKMFWDTKHTFFLGGGQVLCYYPGETNVYIYAVYDEKWNVTESRQFAITLTKEPLIEIDGEPVSEDTWKEEFDWIMDLYHTRPEMMTWEELLE